MHITSKPTQQTTHAERRLCDRTLIVEVMPSPLHLIGHHAARRFLNFKLGWQLFRDPQVSVVKKGTALLIGAAITILLIVCEVPLGVLLGLLAPVVGVAADLMIDGAEMVLLPLLIAMAILPYLVKESDQGVMIRVRSTDHITPA